MALAPRYEPGQRWWRKIFLTCSPLCGRHCTRAPSPACRKASLPHRGHCRRRDGRREGNRALQRLGVQALGAAGPPQGGRAGRRGSRGSPKHPGTSMGMGTGRGPGWAAGPWLGLAWRGPWLGRAALWGPGDRPCCGTAGTGTDSPGGGLTWRPGPARAFPTAFCCGWRPLPSLLEKTCSSASCPGVSALRCCAPPVTMPVSGRGGVTALL